MPSWYWDLVLKFNSGSLFGRDPTACLTDLPLLKALSFYFFFCPESLVIRAVHYLNSAVVLIVAQIIKASLYINMHNLFIYLFI